MNTSGGWHPNSALQPLVDADQRGQVAQHHAFLHGIASRRAAAVPFDEVLRQVVEFVASVVRCDSCFVYVLEGNELVLRASKNPHAEVVDKVTLNGGHGSTNGVAQRRQPIAVSQNAARDVRFQLFNKQPGDLFEAFLSLPLLSRGRVVGVINLQSLAKHDYSEHEISLISTIGFLVGAEIEMASLEKEKSQLADRLEARKLVERAKGILQQEKKLDEQEAYLLMQRQSQMRRKSMKDIAEAIVLSHSVKQGSCSEFAR
jgi:signal transduction protein with GAF and PtsI domain